MAREVEAFVSRFDGLGPIGTHVEEGESQLLETVF